jgi:uncharacterized protein YcfL
MKKLVFLLTIVFLFFSCGSPQQKKPANLISEDLMSEIIFDIILISSAKGINKQLLQNNIENPLNYIYRSYGIDSLNFAQSNDYYTRYPVRYNLIYDKVKARLESEKNYYNAILDEQKGVKDSVRRSHQNQIDTIKIKQVKTSLTKKPFSLSKKGYPLPK